MSRNLNLCFNNKIKSSLSSSSPKHTLPENQSRPFSSSLLFKNYNSLFRQNSDDSDSDSAAAAPDIATVFASRRFFFSSPGRSNSIVDSSISTTSSSCSSSSLRHHLNDAAGAVAVATDSPDPFMDFRRSMQEMVAARGIHDDDDVHQHWDYLHELLMCYLSLNPKPTHKFIVGAFADLLVTLITAAAAPPQDGRRKTPFPPANRKISR